MASVAEGVFTGDLPWTMIFAGMGIAVAVIVLDLFLAHRNSSFRTPVLAVAVGIYLPFALSVPILVGGVIAAIATRVRKRLGAAGEPAARQGLLFGAGLITGEALMGILLAIPIVISGDPGVLAFFGASGVAWPGVLGLIAVSAILYRVATVRRS